MMEIWLCKVLLHPGPLRRPLMAQQLNERSHQIVMAKIISGELGTLPDGCIVEPVSSHATEALANDERMRKLVDAPNEDWRVVITMAVGRP
jgi:hypothetical protein